MNWTAMGEAWPPPNVWLLVAWGGGHADVAHTFTKWRHASNPKGYLIQGHPGSHNCVTHWMPLPDLPSAQSAPQPADVRADQPLSES